MANPKFAIIPSNGRDCLRDAIASICPQVTQTLVVYTGPGQPPDYVDNWIRGVPEINISKWWNQGLATIDLKIWQQRQDPKLKWDVAIINDDVIVPEGWMAAVSTKMRDLGCAAACSGGQSPMPVVHHHAGPVNLFERMQGFAFVLAGEKALRADEGFVWWAGDDDLGWRAAAAGGMVMIPGMNVAHLHPNGQFTPDLQVQAAKDMQYFVDKHGMRPW